MTNVIRNSVDSIPDEELLQQYIHLHEFFVAASAPVEADDSYTHAFDGSRSWLDAAQFWGMYHSYHQTTSAYRKGQIIFVMPELANNGVTECCNELNERVCKVLSATMAANGTAGELFVHRVKHAMAMDRWLLALNNEQDSLMEQMMQNHFQETGVFAKLLSKKKFLDEVRSSNLCNHLPSLGKEGGKVQVLAQYLDSLERPQFEVYMSDSKSLCADIIVRHMETWIHLIVNNVGADIGALKHVSKICKNVIQHCDPSKHGSRHIIVLANSDGDAQPVLSAVRDQLLAAVKAKDRRGLTRYLLHIVHPCLLHPLMCACSDQVAAAKQAIAHTFGTQLTNGKHASATRQEVSSRMPIEEDAVQLQKKRPRTEMDQLSTEEVEQFKGEEAKVILEVILQHNVQVVGLTTEESKCWSEHGLLGHYLMENGVIRGSKCG